MNVFFLRFLELILFLVSFWMTVMIPLLEMFGLL